MFEEARQRAEKYVIDESNRKAESRRPISPTVERMMNEVNEPHDSKMFYRFRYKSLEMNIE